MSTRYKNDDGFSVLEAIVAIAVLAAAMLPILALQSQFVRSVAVMERTQARLDAEEIVRAQIKAVNLTERPRGEMITPTAQIRWSAAPAMEARRVRGRGGVRSRYETTLYKVQIRIDYVSGVTETIVMPGLGWRPMSSFESEL